MMPARHLSLGIAIAVLAVGGAAANAAPRLPRYAALLAGGQRLEGDKLTDWHDTKAMPRLEGQPLLEPSNPLRWLRDRSQRLAEPPASYIEFHNGDRLPGTVIDYRTGQELPFDPQPAHFVVRVGVSFEPPENRAVSEIRVAAQWVRRIVWQHRGLAPSQPGSAIYRDGRSLDFRAVRFHAGETHLLLADGDRRIPWSDLAELHLPAADPWTAHFDQLATLCPTLETRLIEIETAGGLLATASLARLAARFEGNSGDADRWVHGLQPAWSLDILWVPFREIAYYRTWLPREVPLCRIAPRLVRQGGGVGGRRGVALNRSAVGTPLGSKSLDFGFGLGAWGGSELTFDLPLGVRSLRLWVCLDRAAGTGGCIRPRIYANEAKGGPLWEGPLLVGSEQVADTGAIGLAGPAGGQKAIVLQVDPIATGKPAGADPLDIRDYADWCDPLLELDPTVVQAHLDQRLPRRFAAWRDWHVQIGGGTPAEAGLETTILRDERRPPPGEFLAAVQVKQRPLVLSRELTIGPRDQWLLIAATRPLNRGQEPKLEVRIGGEAVAEFNVPERQADPNDNRPLAVSLLGYAEEQPREIQVEIRQNAIADSAPVQYRALWTAEQLPTLFRVFEERAELAAVDPTQPGTALVSGSDRHYGQHSIQVTPAGRFQLALPVRVRIRERPGWGEARFIRFAVKKQGGGRVAVELEDAQPRDVAARYDLGPGKPSYGSAVRIWQDNLPKDWVVMTRDLFADFGSLDAQALVVGAPDGEAAFIDHVYLARNQADFELIPAAPAAALVNEKARHELLQPLIARATPATVRIEFEGGRLASGVIVQEQGEILTAGHAVIGPNRDCRVTFADGTTAKARTQGVARDFDLGLVRIQPDGRYPRLDVHTPADLPQNQPYLALMHGSRIGEEHAAAAELVELRRVFRSTVWTDLGADDWLAGGPLLDQGGRLVAVQVSKSRFGGVLASRLNEAWQHAGRMRNGEVFGAWPVGSEPLMDLAGIAPEGLQSIRRIDGRAIQSDGDLQRAVAERDAGQEIVVDYVRGSETRQAKLKLLPRVP